MLRFKHFCIDSLGLKAVPGSPEMVTQFIAYLYGCGYSPSSISSHLSAISFFHKLKGFADPCQGFLVQRVLLGCKKSAPSFDLRQPILLQDLCKMVKSCKYLFAEYEKCLFSALFLIAFHGFFRMGELVPSNKQYFNRVVQLNNIILHKHSVHIYILHHKTRRSQQPAQVVIGNRETKFCPVKALMKYLRLRGSQTGPLFLLSNGLPVTSSIFNRALKEVLAFVGLSPQFHKGHSFRIGACSEAIKQGLSEETVMTLGRWSSKTAFRRYIRIRSQIGLA